MIRVVVDHLRALGCRPFLTDTNTLYKGSRSDAVSHIETAVRNGFDYAVVGCPLVIADGLKGKSSVRVPIEGSFCTEVSIARGIWDADSLVVVSHFKGHELSGFGGALKNMGMGCAAREGNYPAQHPRPRDRRSAVQRVRALHQLLPRGRHFGRRQDRHDRGAQMHRLRRMHPDLSRRGGAGAVERGADHFQKR